MQKTKRIFCFIVACALLFACLPASLAADDEARWSTDGGTTWTSGDLITAFYPVGQNVIIELLRDVTLSDQNWSEGQTLGKGGHTILLDGKGHTLTRGEGIRKLMSIDGQGGSLNVTFQNITIDGGALWSSDDPATRTNSGLVFNGNAHLATVLQGATLTLEAGTILQNSDLNTTSYGGALDVDEGGTLIVKNGAQIKNCRAESGGGVRVAPTGEMQLQGGTLSGNTASTGGGGAIFSEGTLAISGGVIENNYAGNNGGGVCSSSQNFTMTGGEIKNNASAIAGGVTVLGGSFAMTGGQITGNVGTSRIGGVYINSGSAMAVGGDAVIANNTLNGAAANVRLAAGQLLSISAPLTEGAYIGITALGAPCAVTDSNNTDQSAFFANDASTHGVENGANNAVVLGNDPVTAPTAPREPGFASGVLSWTAPENTGGSAVTYEISTDGGATYALFTAATQQALTNLAPGTYTFAIRAKNSAGVSSAVTVEGAMEGGMTALIIPPTEIDFVPIIPWPQEAPSPAPEATPAPMPDTDFGGAQIPQTGMVSTLLPALALALLGCKLLPTKK